jgi:hypothetical protein
MFYVEERFLPHVKASIEQYKTETKQQIKKYIDKETFDYVLSKKAKMIESPVGSDPFQSANISGSAIKFYKLVLVFLNDLNNVLTDELQGDFILSIKDVMMEYAQIIENITVLRTNLQDRQVQHSDVR